MMRASKIGRTAGRAAVVGLLTVGAWLAATAVANAEYSWEIAPADGNSAPVPAISQTADAGQP